MLLCQRTRHGRPPLLLPCMPSAANPRPLHAPTLQHGARHLAKEFSRRIYSRRCGGLLHCQAGSLHAALDYSRAATAASSRRASSRNWRD